MTLVYLFPTAKILMELGGADGAGVKVYKNNATT